MAKTNSTRTPSATGQSRKTADVIVLDYKPLDILRDLDMLRELVESGEVNGLLFAAKYTKPGKQRHFFGA